MQNKRHKEQGTTKFGQGILHRDDYNNLSFVNLQQGQSFVLSINMAKVEVFSSTFKQIHVAMLTGTEYQYNLGNGNKEWLEAFKKMSYLPLKNQKNKIYG